MPAQIRCTACPRELTTGWEFSDTDLFCPLCGMQSLQFQLNSGGITEPNRSEVWIYSHDRSCQAVCSLSIFRWADSRRIPSSARRIPLPTQAVSWSQAEATLQLPNRTAIPCELRPDEHQQRIILSWPSQPGSSPLPRTGVPGVLRLPGLFPAEWPFRLFPTPERWLTFDPPSTDTDFPLITALLDPANAVARIAFRVSAAQVPVAVRQISLSEGFKSILRTVGITGGERFSNRPEGTLTSTPVLQPNEWTPIQFLFRGRKEPLDPILLEVDFSLKGVPDPVRFSARMEFRFYPSVRMIAGQSVAEMLTVPLGSSPFEFDFFLSDVSEPHAISPQLDPHTALVVSPPEHAAWLTQAARELAPTISQDPQQPTRLRMKVDPGKISRAEFADTTHDVTVTVVDVRGFDLASHLLRVHFPRLPQMTAVLGFDWGTTNNCVASAEGEMVESLPLDAALPSEFERFSSALFVKDVSSAIEPEMAVGTEAHELIEVSEHRECVLRGLKRRFLDGRSIWLRDPRGQSREYSVEAIARQYLFKMVEYLEQRTGKEIGYFGLTYPTKWPAHARERLLRCLQDARDRLAVARPGRQIELVPPILDEATAVALSSIRELANEKHQRPTKLGPGSAVLVVAYDFGGGTIDTVILRAELTAEGQLNTHLVGVGGRPDFGGDDITRAILQLLRDRMRRVLEGLNAGHEFPVLLADEPDRSDRTLPWNIVARQNAERLWRRAEEIKRSFCRAGTPDPTAEHPIAQALGFIELDSLRCYPLGQELSAAPTPSLGALLQAIQDDYRAKFVGQIRFELADVYQTPLEKSKTVGQQLEETFAQLKGQLDDLPEAEQATPRVVVLAGGACRLPIVGQLTQKYLLRDPRDELDFRENFAKQRVAHGKAWYLTFLHAGAEELFALSSASGVTHRALAFSRPTLRGVVTTTVVPAGSPLHSPTHWYPAQVTVDAKAPKPILLWVKEWRQGLWQTIKVGQFLRTTVAPHPGDEMLSEAWPEDLTGSVAVGIRLIRTPAGDPGRTIQQIQLRVRSETRNAWLGPYPLTTLDARGDLEEILQGSIPE